MSSSARFALPHIEPGQAQKEAFHNEALALIDAILCAAVEGAPQATPPPDASPGQSWIVAADATGDWAGHDGQLASVTAGGWRFIVPVAGMVAWDKAANHYRLFDGTNWNDGTFPAARIAINGQQVIGPRQPAIPIPGGGSLVDTEARAAISGLIVALQQHGLVE